MTETKPDTERTPEKAEIGNFTAELTAIGERMDRVFEIVRAKDHDGTPMSNPMADGRMEDGSTAIIARNTQFTSMNPSYTGNVAYREEKKNDRGIQETEESQSPKYIWDWSDPGNKTHQRVIIKDESKLRIRKVFKQSDIDYIDDLMSAVERDNQDGA